MCHYYSVDMNRQIRLGMWLLMEIEIVNKQPVLQGGKSFVLAMVLVLLLPGCAQYQNRVVIHHPGSYQQVRLGFKEVEVISCHPDS